MANDVTVILTAYNMGDVTEADYDAWAAYVGRHIDDVAGVECSVEQAPFGESGEDRVTGASDAVADGIREWLSHEGWNAFCADGSAWPKIWDYSGYWNAVLGANRSAADVVREFELVANGLDEWLGHAEEAARSAGGLADLPEEWTAHHKRALAALEAAL